MQIFFNAILLQLSKESAINFSYEENKKFSKKNKELLAKEITLSVLEKHVYPINHSRGKDGMEFKNYYLSKDMESLKIEHKQRNEFT